MKTSIFTAILLLAYIGWAVATEFTGPIPGAKPELVFTEVPVPRTDTAKRGIFVSPSVRVNGADHPLSYMKLLRTGMKLGEEVYGRVKTKDGQPVFMKDGTPYICDGKSGSDFSSLQRRGENIYLVSQLECDIGGAYIARLRQDEKGRLSTDPGFGKFEGFADDFGTYVGCAGSVTPWNTHLGSEEYDVSPEVVAANIDKDVGQVDPDFLDNSDPNNNTFGNHFEYNKCWNECRLEAIALNNGVKGPLAEHAYLPYYQGYITEIDLDESGNPSSRKHYALGRFSHELAYVMPDRRTVYMSDDGTSVGFYMFVADRPGDLSSGTLYAARWEQVEASGGGRANIKWIKLAHNDTDTVRGYLEAKTVYTDFMREKPVSGPEFKKTCPTGFRQVITNKEPAKCVQVKPGKEKIAAALETRLFAAWKGATTEFRKTEGVTYNPDANILYLSASEIARGMEDFRVKGKPADAYDVPGENHIQLPYNRCGVVYAGSLSGGIRDRAGQAIESDFVVTTFTPEVVGRTKDYSQIPELATNRCDLEGIANPDNITYLPGYGVLIIGEDGSNHQNDMVWAYDTRSKKLTRIATTPYGSETTSPYWYPDLNGFGYLTLVVQHPYGESDVDKFRPGVDTKANIMGVIGPFPSLK